MSGHAETITGPQLHPTLHRSFKVGDRVRIKNMGPEVDGRTGTITGISSVHVIFGYILTLDVPLKAPEAHPGEDWTTVSIFGGCLELCEGEG